jgi:hypothetical protein
MPNAFINKRDQPTRQELDAVLGAAGLLWDKLVTDLADDHGIVTQEWKSTSPKYGWSLRLKREKRTIVYLSPSKNCFNASLVLGGRAVEAARRSKLPQAVLKAIDESLRYAEGTGVRLLVKQAREVAIVTKLAAIKLEN